MMEKKRYESRFFIVMLFVILGCSLMISILDPTSIARKGDTISVALLSGINQALVWVGMGMILLGMVIRFVAIATLKKNFSGRLRIRADHNLVTNGIYHWIRHPAYLGAILFFLGFPIIVSSVLGFLVMFFIVPLVLRRIRDEERMLIERFGSEYEEYIKQSKMLIPFFY
jgi:protein-S-isoprenylcysteine O-methyltransferase Ste14